MKYLTAKQAAQRFKVNLSTIWRWQKARGFPQGIKFGPQSVRLDLADIERWEAAQKAA